MTFQQLILLLKITSIARTTILKSRCLTTWCMQFNQGHNSIYLTILGSHFPNRKAKLLLYSQRLGADARGHPRCRQRCRRLFCLFLDATPSTLRHNVCRPFHYCPLLHRMPDAFIHEMRHRLVMVNLWGILHRAQRVNTGKPCPSLSLVPMFILTYY